MIEQKQIVDVTFTMTRKAFDRLEQRAQESGMTETEVIGRGLALLDVYLSTQWQGGRILIQRIWRGKARELQLDGKSSTNPVSGLKHRLFGS